jgi:hypothetical protein
MIDLDEFERRLRHPNASSKTAADDPLAELARLVGGQDDPYKAMFGTEPPVSASAYQPETGREAAGPLGSLRETVTPSAHNAQADFADFDSALRRDRLGPDRFAGYGGAPDHWSEADPGAGSYRAELGAEAPRSRRSIYLMAAIIGVGMAGIGASFVLKGARTDPQDIATITAPEGPAKVAVEATAASRATGPAVTVLERAPQAERVGLADTREQPVDLSQVPERAPRAIGIAGAKGDPDKTTGASGAAQYNAAQVPVPVPPGQVSAPHAQEAQVGLAALIEPRKVKTISVRPDGTLVPNPPSPVQAVDVPLPARRPATPAAKAATPKLAERAATTPKPVLAPRAAVEPQQAAPEPVPAASTPAPAKGTYAVQVAAPETEQAARAVQVKVMKKLGNELAGFHTSIRKAAVGDKTVYRVRVGDLSREEAVGLCQKMKSGGTDCFVARN